jgi:EAL domain-containing protein (putative c-di-GMP-specific phosphodiesterase class I)
VSQGKPAETLGRKATGLRTVNAVYDSRAATAGPDCAICRRPWDGLGPPVCFFNRCPASERNLQETREFSLERDHALCAGITGVQTDLSPASIAAAIQSGEMDVHFQPIICHDDPSWLGLEALSRPLACGRPIRPDLWFRTAEAAGMALEADSLAVTTALRRLSESSWAHRAVLFVNLLPSTLDCPDFPQRLCEWLTCAGWQPERLVIEIVEYVWYDPAQLARALASLRTMGVRVALDDFGAPGGSLSALIELEPDVVKVDRALVQGVAVSQRKQRLLEHLLVFLERGTWFIAEGVEDQGDLAVLLKLGVPFSQGYFWSRPIPVEELPAAGRRWLDLASKELDRA